MLGHRLGTTITAVALAALTPLLACGGDDDASGTTTTETPQSTDAPTTTLSPEEQTKADVRAAYDAYWAMNKRLAAAPDPQDPEIAERTTGGAQDALITLLTQFLTAGHVVEFQDEFANNVLAVEVDGSTAQVRDCHVDDAVRLVKGTGEVVQDATSTLHLNVRLIDDQGTWKVEQLERIDSWEGVVACE